MSAIYTGGPAVCQRRQWVVRVVPLARVNHLSIRTLHAALLVVSHVMRWLQLTGN